MSKTEECGLLVRSDRCGNFSGYEGEGFLVCEMHPAGPETTPCPDWDLVEDDWFPCGATYVDGELVLAQADFLGHVLDMWNRRIILINYGFILLLWLLLLWH
jgi:hypothetical protein